MFSLMMVGASPVLATNIAVAHNHVSASSGRRWHFRERACVRLLLNFLALFVAGFNIVCAYADVNRKNTVSPSRGGLGRANGYEAVIIANLILMVGVVFGRQLLISVWLCAYSFILVICSIQSILGNDFPWTPGISYSSTNWVMERLDLHESIRPVVATTITLTCFMLVFLVFMVKGILKFQRVQSRSDRGEGGDGAADLGGGGSLAAAEQGRTGGAPNGSHHHNHGAHHHSPFGGLRDILWQALREPPTVEELYTVYRHQQHGGRGAANSASRPPGTISPHDSLPAYSDLEQECAESSNQSPPLYEDATKDDEVGKEGQQEKEQGEGASVEVVPLSMKKDVAAVTTAENLPPYNHDVSFPKKKEKGSKKVADAVTVGDSKPKSKKMKKGDTTSPKKSGKKQSNKGKRSKSSSKPAPAQKKDES